MAIERREWLKSLEMRICSTLQILSIIARKTQCISFFLEKVLYICSVIHFSAYDRTYRVYVSSGEMER